MTKIKKICVLTLSIVIFILGFSLACYAVDEQTEPIKISGVSAVSEPYAIKIKWDIQENVTGYKIYRRVGNGKSTLIGEVSDGMVNSYYDNNVSSGKTYYYSVKAFNETTESKISKECKQAFVSSPKNVKVVNKRNYVNVTWSKLKGAKEYRVYRAVENGGWKKIATVKNNVFAYKDKAIKHSVTYKYTVIAKYGNLWSAKGGGIKNEYFQYPSVLSLKNKENNIIFSWNAINGASAYSVYRMNDDSGKWVLIDTVSETKYIDENIENGKSYYYTVRALSENGGVSYFLPSDKFIAIFKPEDLKLSNVSGGVRISWKKSAVSEGYMVYKAEKGKWVKIATLKGQKNTYFDDKAVKNGKEYQYTVKSYHSGIGGSYENYGVTETYYAAPTLKISQSSKGVSLSWSATTKGISYSVYHKTDGGSWTELTKVLFLNDRSFLHKTPVYGEKNHYKIVVNGTEVDTFSYTRSVYGINPNKKLVALTYDDGPYSPVTNKILDTLEKYNCRATFFVVGNRVNTYKKSVVRAVQLDCEIANHTYNHQILTRAKKSVIESEINKTNSAVKKVTGITPTIVRAPGGSINSSVKKYVKYPLINWSVDTLDWKNRNAKSIVKIIKTNVEDGSIILMHDLYKSTGEATATIVPWLIKNGYQIVTVSEMMAYEGVNMKSGKVYYSAYK